MRKSISAFSAALLLVLVRTIAMFELTFLTAGPTSQTLVVPVPGDGVAVAGAARGAQPQTPAGDDDRAAVVTDLAHLEDGRLATPGLGVLPSTVPLAGTERLMHVAKRRS